MPKDEETRRGYGGFEGRRLMGLSASQVRGYGGNLQSARRPSVETDFRKRGGKQKETDNKMVIGLAESLHSWKQQRLPRLEYLAGRDHPIMRLKVHPRGGSTSLRRHTDVYEIRVPRCQRTALKKKRLLLPPKFVDVQWAQA